MGGSELGSLNEASLCVMNQNLTVSSGVSGHKIEPACPNKGRFPCFPSNPADNRIKGERTGGKQ